MKIGERKSWLLLLLLFSVQLGAIPKPERTNLPIPAFINESDKELLQAALQLQVYQDAEDPNQYYYTPPMHFKQYTIGAARMTLNYHNVENYAAAQASLKELYAYRKTYTVDQLQVLPQNIKDRESKVKEAKEAVMVAKRDLETAKAQGDEESIAFYKNWLQEEIGSYEEAKKNLQKARQELEDALELFKKDQHILPPGLGRSYFDQAVLSISLMGAPFSIAGSKSTQETEDTIKAKLAEVSVGDGGFISANVYGGFTRAQREALAAYRQNYFPYIKISLLPVEKLSFISLSDWQKNPERKSSDVTTMIANIRGSGDYLGIAIVMNITVNGALGLATRLGPFIPPIGIKATFKQKIHPVDAELTCDFSNGYTVKGRSDVRDGAIIYDNDLTTDLKGNDIEKGACDVKVKSGDVNSAYIQSLSVLEQKFAELKWERTILSKKEKEEYLQKVKEDVQNNRGQGGSRYEGIFSSLPGLGWIDYVIPVLTKAADFHWHTNVQDVENLSTVKFTKKIKMQGHEIIERDLPIELCLTYNKATEAYDRCSQEEEAEAMTMPQATTSARASLACKDVFDPYKCGLLRDEAGETVNRELKPVVKDNEVPLTIQ